MEATENSTKENYKNTLAFILWEEIDQEIRRTKIEEKSAM